MGQSHDIQTHHQSFVILTFGIKACATPSKSKSKEDLSEQRAKVIEAHKGACFTWFTKNYTNVFET